MEITYDFGGRSALVSGGASGIGRAVAAALLDAGAAVCVLDRNREALEKFRLSRTEDAERLLVVPCDLARAGETSEAFAFARDRFGVPHFLVNSVGINLRKPALDLGDEELEEMFRVNFFGVSRLCRLAASAMAGAREAGRYRKIVNIASTGAWQGSKNYSGYNSSKAALVASTRIFANEWYERGIVVNSVCPGPTMTPFVETYYRERPELVKSIIMKTPAGRIAEPEDHVGPVLFLLSAASDWIVGQAIASDGGKGLNN